MKEKWATLLGGIAGVCLSLLAAQVLLTNVEQSRLLSYANSVLAHAVDVAASNSQELAAVLALDTSPCSEDDIDRLRNRVFKARYVADIGRVVDGRVACSAVWGRLTPPRPVPPSRFVSARGVKLWVASSDVLSPGITADMAGKGNVLLFVAPTAFYSYELMHPHYGVTLRDRGGKRVFRIFGQNGGDTASHDGRFSFLHRDLEVSVCSETFDVCATARSAQADMFLQSWAIILSLVGAGALAGGSIGRLAMFYRREYSSLPRQLRRAIVRQRFTVRYQPLVRLHDNAVVGAEALIRWNDESGNVISPDVFIRVAEESGMIGDISRQMIDQALEQMRVRLTRERDFYISMNLPVQDVLDPLFPAFLDRAADQRAIAHERIVLEITERATADLTQLADAMDVFRRRGYRFAIDDFGTGYSNLAYLTRLNIDVVKIDRIFTRLIGSGDVGNHILESMCMMLNKLEIGLVVEGIETEEQAQYIVGLHPDAIGQGYLFGMPVGADVFPESM